MSGREQAAAAVQVVERLSDANSRNALERLASSGLAEAGKLTLISLQEVADRFGARWPVRASGVYEHVERALLRQLRSDAHFVRVSNTDYLVAQPCLEPQIAQAVALKIVREILRHFLGEIQPAPLAIMVVRLLDAERIEAGRIDMVAVHRLAEQSIGELNATGSASAPLAVPTAWSPFAACDGKELHVVCALEPVLSLKNNGSLGLRVRREVLTGTDKSRLSANQIAMMPRADIEKVDRAAIYQGMHMARELAVRPMLLGLPISLRTLSSSRGRQMFVDAMKEARSMTSCGLICGLHHVEDSPSANLLAAKAVIRHYCIKTIANLIDPTKVSVRALKDVGIDGIGIEVPEFDGDAQFLGWAKSVVSWAAGAVGGVGLYGLPSDGRVAIAATMGVKYATVQSVPSGGPKAGRQTGDRLRRGDERPSFRQTEPTRPS